MGETDMGPQADQPGTAVEADTTPESDELSRADYAEQRRAEARAALEPPTHFDTPSWMGPSSRPYVQPEVPVQAEPVHEQVQVHAYAPVPVADTVPEAAHWVEHRKPRYFVGLLLTLAIAGAIVSLVFAILDQSVVAIVGLVLCTIVAVIFRSALMSSALTTVDLKSSTLKVRQEGERHLFNLADPTRNVEVTGTPGRGDWKVVLESVDGRQVTLTGAHVNSEEFDKVLLYYRAIAERERQDQYNRFNR